MREITDTPASNVQHYEIRLKGHLEGRWSRWFEGLTITPEENGNTLLSGPMADQAALHGLLKKVRDVGLPVLSINSLEPDAEERNVKTWEKPGGLAALVLAVTYLIGMAIFLAVLDYLSITDPLQKVALLVEKQAVIFSTNLVMYVSFGVLLIVLSLALHHRLKAGAPAIMQVATVIGIIWAGSLIASGMVANAGIAPVISLYATNPAQAALSWQGIETVANGLGNANGEILGGLWTLLVSVAALRTGGLPRGLNILGVFVGGVGIISLIPGLTDLLIGVFGLGQIIWFAWLGIVLLRSSSGKLA